MPCKLLGFFFIGKYQFIIGELTYTAVQQFSYKPVIWTTDMEDIYVNFQWAEYDSVRNVVYLLMGNENSPERLQARIYTYDLDKRLDINCNNISNILVLRF